jgi:hypothetical protein
MATVTSDSATRLGELRLADTDPQITHSGSGSDRFNAKFTLVGVDLLELENVLKPRLAGVGVERVTRIGMTMTLYGVEQGREVEALSVVESAIADVNRARKAAREDVDRRRSATEAAEAVSETQLEAVRESFRAARQTA